jgi:hypothetical protein
MCVRHLICAPVTVVVVTDIKWREFSRARHKKEDMRYDYFCVFTYKYCHGCRSNIFRKKNRKLLSVRSEGTVLR